MSEKIRDGAGVPEKEGDALLVARHKAIALLRIRGRGSFKIGPSLKQFGRAAMEEGCTQFILDMDECVGMDSTFMGVLAGLAMRLRNEKHGTVVMMNLTPKTSALLETLGLDRLIEMHQAGHVDERLKQHLAEVVDLTALEASISDRKLTMETMLAAHEDLVAASPDNLPKFKSVMAYLSADLKQLEGS